MSLTREDMMRELELLPVWRLNAALTQPILQPLAQTALAESIAAPIVEQVTTQSSEAKQAPAAQPEIADMDWAALNQYITGAGDTNADCLFVGDAPSADEVQTGQPFGGDAGVLLDKMLMAIQLQRSKNVYLTHLSELDYFNRQIALIKPSLIFVFGETPARILLNAQAPLDELRGKVHQYQGVSMIASYAPLHLISHTQDKAKAWADLCLARDTLQSLKEADVKPISL